MTSPISRYRKTWLRVNRRQFHCSSCGKPFSEGFEFVGGCRVYTDRYAEVVVADLIHSDATNVLRKHGLSDGIVWSMVEYVGKSRYDLYQTQQRNFALSKVAVEESGQRT